MTSSRLWKVEKVAPNPSTHFPWTQFKLSALKFLLNGATSLWLFSLWSTASSINTEVLLKKSTPPTHQQLTHTCVRCYSNVDQSRDVWVRVGWDNQGRHGQGQSMRWGWQLISDFPASGKISDLNVLVHSQYQHNCLCSKHNFWSKYLPEPPSIAMTTTISSAYSFGGHMGTSFPSELVPSSCILCSPINSCLDHGGDFLSSSF